MQRALLDGNETKRRLLGWTVLKSGKIQATLVVSGPPSIWDVRPASFEDGA